MDNNFLRVESISNKQSKDFLSLRDHYRVLEYSYEQQFIKFIVVGSGAAITLLLTSVVAIDDPKISFDIFRFPILGFAISMMLAGVVPFMAAKYYSDLTSEMNNLASQQSFDSTIYDLKNKKKNHYDPLALLDGEIARSEYWSKHYNKIAIRNSEDALYTEKWLKRFLAASLFLFSSSLLYSLNVILFL